MWSSLAACQVLLSNSEVVYLPEVVLVHFLVLLCTFYFFTSGCMYSVACQLQKVLAIEYSQRAAYLLAYCIALKENLFALYKTVMVLAHPHCLNVNTLI